MYMSHDTIGCSLSLLTLAAGYIVLLKASKETKILRLLGLIIATIIIASTLLMGVCKMLNCGKSGSCGIMGKKAMMGMGTSDVCPVMPADKK